MPLQSRASTARAQRTAPEQQPANVASDVQPRRGKEKPAETPNVTQTPPPAADTATTAANDGASQNASQSDSGAGTQQAPVKERKPRTAKVSGTKVSADGTSATDTKALKERLKEIEKEFKLLIPEEQKSMREVAQKFKEKRLSLESEHRLITGQLSAAIFHG